MTSLRLFIKALESAHKAGKRHHAELRVGLLVQSL